MKQLLYLVSLFVFGTNLFGQTRIQFIVRDKGQHKIDKVDAFDISQKETKDLSYQDTLLLSFDKQTVDNYCIRFHENDKMFRQSLWLDTGNIKVIAHIDSDQLFIDTVINSPFYYYVQDFVNTFPDINKTKDTATLNTFLLKKFTENQQNPFSLMVAHNFILLNQNSKSNLTIMQGLLGKQGSTFDWFILYSSDTARLKKALETKKVDLKKFVFTNVEGKKVREALSSADYYVLDFWFLACQPCVVEHKDIKKDYAKLAQKKVEIISISRNEDFTTWKSYLTKHNYDWRNYVQDEKNRLTTELGISTYPTYIVLDSKGEISATYNSFEDIKKRFDVD